MKFMKWIGFFIIAAMFVACAPKNTPLSTEQCAPVSTETFDGTSLSKKRSNVAFIGCVKEQVLPIYDKYILKRHGLTGLIGVTMTVRQDGGIDSVLIDTSSVNYPELEKEVQEKLGQLKCPLIYYNTLKARIDIRLSAEGVTVTQARSANQIMNVIRINTPQRLKPIYNHYLKERYYSGKDSFDGKVTVKWSILSNGDVENAKIIEATTEYPEFEKAILDDIKQWKFEGGEYGRTTVTVPFTFSE